MGITLKLASNPSENLKLSSSGFNDTRYLLTAYVMKLSYGNVSSAFLNYYPKILKNKDMLFWDFIVKSDVEGNFSQEEIDRLLNEFLKHKESISEFFNIEIDDPTWELSFGRLFDLLEKAQKENTYITYC